MADEQVVEATPEELAAQAANQPEDVSVPAADDNNAPIVPEPPKPDRIQKRLDRLTWEANEARREAERLRAELERKSQESAPAKPIADGKPKEDDFGDAAEFVEALANWKYDQRAGEDRAKAQKQEQERAQQELQQRVQRDIAVFKTVTPDFDEVMEDATFNSTKLMIRELQESDNGPALLYHFAKNPDEANEIAKLTDERKVAKAIAKIEAKLSSAPAQNTAPVPTTSTPAPIKPVPASRQAVARRAGDVSDADYFAQERAANRMR